MSYFFKLIIIALFFIQISGLPSIVQADDSSKSETNSTKEIKAFLDQFHHEIEDSNDLETNSKLKKILAQWLDNFNLARISMDTYRWTQMKYYQDNGKSEYIKNFPVLASFYFLSHTIEVMSGPLGVYIANDLGLGSSAKVMIGSVGAIISIPGLDPLCILLFAISPTRPMQKIMSGIRLVAVKVSGTVSNQLHLKEAASKIFESKDRLAEIVNSSKDVVLDYNLDNDKLSRELVVRSAEKKPYLALGFKNQNGREFVDYLRVLDSEILLQNRRELETLMKGLNRTARSALLRAIDKPKTNFYTNSVLVEGIETKVEFKDFAVLIKPKVQFRKSQAETKISAMSCSLLFR